MGGGLYQKCANEQQWRKADRNEWPACAIKKRDDQRKAAGHLTLSQPTEKADESQANKMGYGETMMLLVSAAQQQHQYADDESWESNGALSDVVTGENNQHGIIIIRLNERKELQSLNKATCLEKNWSAQGWQ